LGPEKREGQGNRFFRLMAVEPQGEKKKKKGKRVFPLRKKREGGKGDRARSLLKEKEKRKGMGPYNSKAFSKKERKKTDVGSITCSGRKGKDEQVKSVDVAAKSPGSRERGTKRFPLLIQKKEKRGDKLSFRCFSWERKSFVMVPAVEKGKNSVKRRSPGRPRKNFEEKKGENEGNR